MLKEFKVFIAKGNVVELAVGLILATYFGAIVKSMVDDLLMPLLGQIIGKVDFTKLKYVIHEAILKPDGTVDTAEIAVRYGLFINTIITFILVALTVFLVVKAYNRMKRKEIVAPSVPPVPTMEETLLTEIRDILKNK